MYAGRLPAHGAQASRHYTVVAPPFYHMAEQTFRHGAATNIARANKQNSLHRSAINQAWVARRKSSTRKSSACLANDGQSLQQIESAQQGSILKLWDFRFSPLACRRTILGRTLTPIAN